MAGVSVDTSRQMEPEAKSAHLLLRLRNLPLNCSFVLVAAKILLFYWILLDGESLFPDPIREYLSLGGRARI